MIRFIPNWLTSLLLMPGVVIHEYAHRKFCDWFRIPVYRVAYFEGMYKCAVCGNPLFESKAKFETHMPGLEGWPSFEDAIPGSVEFKSDDSDGMHRTEVICKKCGSHLGHVFEADGETKTGKHYCVNSVCLNLAKSGRSVI